MAQKNAIVEMPKFHFGSNIACTDGEDGILSHVIFDPATFRITHIGVKQGWLFGRTFTVPFETVTTARDTAVRLNIRIEELAAANVVDASGVKLDAKSSVENVVTGNRGTLMLVAMQPENGEAGKAGELAYLVAHHLHHDHDTLLQRQFVTELTMGTVRVNIPEAALNALAPYRSDAELQAAVEAILFDITSLHIDMKGIIIRVIDSVLYIDGNVSSSLRVDIISDQVRGVHGLVDTRNNLVADDALGGDLAMAIGRDQRTSDLPIGVYPRLGHIRLDGAVHTNAQKVAAEEIARAFPGVRSVSNELVVNPNADMIYVMAPSETGNAEDIVPGKYVRHTK